MAKKKLKGASAQKQKPKKPIAAGLLRGAFQNQSDLITLVQNGLGAVEGVDRALIALDQRHRPTESLDLDTASQPSHPQANRWDYLLAIDDLRQIIGLEPHSTRDDQISVVIAKKQQARQFLENHLRPGQFVARWFWVTHGSVDFSKMEGARRRLDQHGISFMGRSIRSFD